MLQYWLIPLLVYSAATPLAIATDQPDDVSGSAALREFLRRFDAIESMGFVKTRRPGPTGVGYTLESLLGIKENNSPRGDLLGMEIKAYRDDEVFFNDRTRMNLFLKEPIWVDDLTTADRIRKYGYVGKFNRQSWYQSVTNKQNQNELTLRVQRDLQRVELEKSSRVIGYWTFDTLERRLREKLTEMVFVSAATQHNGAEEVFHYRSVTWCNRPALTSFLELIESGDVVLELRMHLKESGSARNHGTAFRLHKHRIRDLFHQCVQCRPSK